ncbi:MAG TPA: transposase, partial [Candidatus Sulfotelmatobacter sp.]|nr:transposase [Candidatus Sulfotelmatobacter sp.]
RGRDFAAWVGVVPRQHSTGGKRSCKHQQARQCSSASHADPRRSLGTVPREYDTGGFGQWVRRLTQRAPSNKVVVAIANKLARIAWAVLSSGKDCRHQPVQPLAAAA